jgi:2',3'-cyclic-nucleotide 2'-phosphodiesterase/3'-nucleotidase
MKIKIIETTDVHGAVFDWDPMSESTKPGSLARVCSYVKQQRADKTQSVILLDNGDKLQGNPLVYYANFEDTKRPHFIAQVMNYMGYGAATIGNHDFEAGHSIYDPISKEFNFPWLAANAISTKTDAPYFKPYTRFNVNGVSIVVLGLTTPGVPNWIPEQNYEGIRFDDMIESAKFWMKIIQEREEPDIVVGLFHSGINPEFGNAKATDLKNENATRLVAEQVPGFDLVLGGHDHLDYNQWIVNKVGKKVLILDPGSSARGVAVGDFRLEKIHGKWQLLELRGAIVSMDKYKQDPAFLQKFAYYIENVQRYVDRKIGYFKMSISSRDAFFGSSAFIDLIHKAQLDIAGADISFASPLTLDATITRGDLEVKDMFRLYRFENFLYTMQLSGKEVKGALEFSYNLWVHTMKSEKDHMINFKLDSLNRVIVSQWTGRALLLQPFFNFESASGIKYTVDLSKPYGQRVFISSLQNGELFCEDSVYKVAINSYRGNGGGKHLTLGSGIPQPDLRKRVLRTTKYDLRNLMMQWIEKQDTLNPKPVENWQFIPEQWAKRAAVTDAKLLFGD